MSYFPDELVDVILLLLPVKSLLRFRCVSKTWCSLIDSYTFVKKHLNYTTETNSKHKLLLHSSDNLYSVSLYSLADQILKLDQPINVNLDIHTILGHCNGLLCLSYGLNRNLVLLWNPAIQKHVKLPIVKPRRYVGSDYVFEYGFGYDLVSDDYKVVKMHQFYTDEHFMVSETNVYSLRSNSWRMVEDITHYLIDEQGPGALACGALHWIGWDSDSRLVTAFDLATEKYMMVPLPDVSSDDVLRMLVSELGGCLSFVFDHSMIGVFNVWVMKAYGVSESWTKLLTISILDSVRSIGFVIPLAYSESGDEVLLVINSEKLLWYNLEKRTFKDVHISGISWVFYPVISLESLVSLGEQAENDEKQDGENEGAKGKGNEEEQEIGQPIDIYMQPNFGSPETAEQY